MRSGEPNVYTSLVILRNGYTQLQWSRVQMALVFNTIAIPIVFGSGQAEIVKVILSIAGLVGHFALLVAALRGDGWIKYYDEKLDELERLDQEDENPNGVRVMVFSGPDFQIRRTGGITSRKVLGPIGTFFIVFWVEESIRHLVQLFTTS